MQLAVAQLCPGGQPLLPASAQKQFSAAGSTAAQLLTAALQLCSLPSGSAQASSEEPSQVRRTVAGLGQAFVHGVKFASSVAETEQISDRLAKLSLPSNLDAASSFLVAVYALDAVAVQLHSVSASKPPPPVAGSHSQLASRDELLADAARAWGLLRLTASAFLRACQQLARGSVEA